MFTGLSAFPLTPIPGNGSIDEQAYGRLVRRLATAGVDSIGALGSTGSYAYLTRPERARAARIAVEHADGVPVIVGIGALRTRHVLEAAEDAQNAGAAGVLLAPVSYQPLTDDDVFGLFEDVTASLSVPLVVYDNPRTTRFTFTDELYARLGRLPNVASIKIPGVPADPAAARARIEHLRHLLPATVTIGVSGDADAARGLNAGCDAWYSVIGGLFPEVALALTRAAQTGRAEQESQRLQPLWDLFAQHGGSLRVVAAAAARLGLTAPRNLPLPLRGLDAKERAQVASVIEGLQLHP
ncbi:dihydrodipicolinate synthase family protein [Streptomyces antimycoticus]|uniref:Dihydrodipicolinate synthase family protein n=1 Tax=Streptomyces antimycoticus TaxID=68175 RepID=A0A499UX84_9ACTN|nr:dihydrodipicolinate synthase family protein [Streptomyces antimycoticus]BBJ45270.1 dihydrodipicolinate synthase family protein [Streptomyces antimycoticus]